MSNSSQDLTGLWMVPYADLMSTLVILFLALFAYSYVQRSPEYEKAVAHMQEDLTAATAQARRARTRSREAELAVRLKDDMSRLALEEFGLNITSRYVHLVLPAPVLFAEGSSALGPGAEKVLEPLAKLFASVDNPVRVEGHTDDQPIARSRHRTNFELSAARAFSVIEFFIRGGLKPERFQALGRGEHRPAASNRAAAGRRANRRIEISLVRAVEESRPDAVEAAHP